MSTLITNLTDYAFFIDIYSEQSFSITPSINSSGIVYLDNNSNIINGTISNGRRNIYQCTSLAENIILYDDTNFVYIDSTFDVTDIDYRFLMKQRNNLRYLFDSNREIPSSVSNYILTIDLTDKLIFKVFINGNESTDYINDTSSITIQNTDVNFFNNVSDYIVVYTYNSIQTVTGTTTFNFKGVDKLTPDESDLIDESFFSDKTSIRNNFDDNFSISEDRVLSSLNRTYDYIIEKKELDRKLKVSFPQFGNDLRLTLRNQNFRILAWNKNDSVLYIFNNCYWNDSANTTFQKSKNEVTVSIDIEEILKINYTEGSIYGVGVYGSYYYGTGQFYENLTDVV